MKKLFSSIVISIFSLVGMPLFAHENILPENKPFHVEVTPSGKYIYKIPDALDTENWMIFLTIKNNESESLKLKNITFNIYSSDRKISSLIKNYNIDIVPEFSKIIPMIFFRENRDLDASLMELNISTNKGTEKIDVHLKRYQQPVKVFLPLKGVWHIGSAHEFGITHRRWDNKAQFAYDFIKIDGNGNLYTGNPDKLEDYFAFGQSVFAPGTCTVLEIHDGESDNPIGKTSKNANFVNLDLGNGVTCTLAHFKKNSIIVKEGQKLEIGDKIAEVGNSGRSDNPHLHIHIQEYGTNSKNTLKPSFPLPLSFSDYYVHPPYLKEWEFINMGNPNSGDFVKSAK